MRQPWECPQAFNRRHVWCETARRCYECGIVEYTIPAHDGAYWLGWLGLVLGPVAVVAAADAWARSAMFLSKCCAHNLRVATREVLR